MARLQLPIPLEVLHFEVMSRLDKSSQIMLKSAYGCSMPWILSREDQIEVLKSSDKIVDIFLEANLIDTDLVIKTMAERKLNTYKDPWEIRYDDPGDFY